MFVTAVASQLLALTLLPRTRGFADPVPTLACCVFFLLSVGMMARLQSSGINLSTLVPFMAAVIPLAVVVIGMVAYGEVASWAKASMLIGACCLVGLAARIG